MAFVAEERGGDIAGVSRLISDPEGEAAEFALMVRSDRQRQGLGSLLLQALLDHAAQRGIGQLWGEVARDNPRMLALGARFGFTPAPNPDPTRMRLVKILSAPGPAAERFATPPVPDG
jgi:acetyltransferase